MNLRSLIALTAAFSCLAAHAQDYPNKPIRLVVSASAGGTSDILARLVVPKVSQALGQPIVVDIRPGAGGNIGADMVAKAAPDGYTLLMNYPAFTSNQAFYGNLPFDPAKDFSPITLLVEMPVVVVVNPNLPVNSLQDLIALAKRQPGKLNFGSSGNGGVGHLVGEMFNSAADVKMVHVPYKGNGPALVDVVTGVLSLTFSDIAGALPHINNGKMRPLAIAADKRSVKLPNVPTMSEAGLPGFKASSWFGIVTTAGTPQPIVNRLNAEFTKALHSQELRDRLTEMSFVVAGNSTTEFAEFLRAETAKWVKVIKDTGANKTLP